MARSDSRDSSNYSQNIIQEKTLFEKHRALIFPNSNSQRSKSKSSMSAGGNTGKSAGSSDISPAANSFGLKVENQNSVNTPLGSQSTNISSLLLPKKYKWYPNLSIENQSSSR